MRMPKLSPRWLIALGILVLIAAGEGVSSSTKEGGSSSTKLPASMTETLIVGDMVESSVSNGLIIVCRTVEDIDKLNHINLAHDEKATLQMFQTACQSMPQTAGPFQVERQTKINWSTYLCVRPKGKVGCLWTDSLLVRKRG